jgi:hypothetical protein
MRVNFLLIVLLFLSQNSYSKRKEYSDIKNNASHSQKVCQLSSHCEKNKNPYWAKFQYGADLADSEIQKLFNEYNIYNRKDFFSNTAVVDSGFDGRSQIDFLNVVPKLFKGYNEAGKETIDPEGHGTAVSGMIAGKGVGFTKFVNLNIYRVTKKFGGGSVRTEHLASAIRKACDTSEIVNVSWGSSAGERGMRNPKDENWFEYAASKGCLIVKSSGNGGIKKYNSYNLPITAPIILVSSTNSLGTESSFSSQGHIYGPGENVFTLSSHQAKVDQWGFEKYCRVNGSIMAPISGTSFSSPAVAAVFSQVLTVLKIKNLVPENPSEKISLLKKIILASGQWSLESGEALPTANAYLAVLIAKNLKDGEKNLSVNELVSVGKREISNECSVGSSICFDTSSCADKKRCINSSRKKMYLCEEQRKEITIDLINSLNQMKEAELISYMGSRLNSKDFDKETILEILNKSWVENYDEKYKRIEESDIAFDLFERALLLGLDSFISKDRFLSFLTDSYFISGIDSKGDSEFDFLFHREKSEREKQREKEAGVVSFGEIRKRKIFNLYKNLDLEVQALILESLPKKRYQFEEDFSDIQSGFLSLLVENKNELDLNIQKILIEKVHQLSLSLAKELSGDNKYISSLNKNKINLFLKVFPSFLDPIKESIKRPLFNNSKNKIRFIYNYAELVVGKSQSDFTKEILNELVGKIEMLEKVNTKNSKKEIMSAQKLFESINNILPRVLKNIIESKTSDLTLLPQVKRILLSDLPLILNAKVIIFSKYLATPFQSAFYDDTNFLKEFILKRIKATQKVFSLKGLIWEGSWKTSGKSLVKVLDNLYIRIKYKHNFDYTFLNEPLTQALSVLTDVYESERQAKKITKFQMGFLSKYVFNRGEKHITLTNQKKYSSRMAIYVGTNISTILKFYRKLEISTSSKSFTSSLKKLKFEYDSDNDRLDIGEIRDEISRVYGLKEFE